MFISNSRVVGLTVDGLSSGAFFTQ